MDIDYSKYSKDEVLKMLNEKQKEYVILLQSEKLAQMLLDKYNGDFYTSSYHTKLKIENYALLKEAQSRNLKTSNPLNCIGIPNYCVLQRLVDSRDEAKALDDINYHNYDILIDNVSDYFKIAFYGKKILWKDGELYVTLSGDKELLLDDEAFNYLIDNKGDIPTQKIKH